MTVSKPCPGRSDRCWPTAADSRFDRQASGNRFQTNCHAHHRPLSPVAVLEVFVICFFSLTGLYIVIDGFSYLDNFMAPCRQAWPIAAVIGEYYAYKSISFFDLTSGILTLIAGDVHGHLDSAASRVDGVGSAGLSKGRIIKPVIVAVAAISLLAALNRELVIPRIRVV